MIRSAMAGLGFREKLAATLDIHPYYPPGISLPGWKPVLVPYNRLIAGFFAFFAVLAAAAWGLTSEVATCIAAVAHVLSSHSLSRTLMQAYDGVLERSTA